MKENCLRKLLEGFPLLPENKEMIPLTLLCCNVCRKIDNNEELNRYEELYIFPLILSYRKENHVFSRTIGSSMMERTAEKFGNADVGQVNDFLSLLARASEGKDSYSVDDLLLLSEGSYCQVIARLYWSANYDLVRILAIQYIFNTSNIIGSNVRNNWYHKDEDNPFFVIGVGLDEGIVQSLTKDMLANEFPDDIENLSDAYFFEQKFVNKLIETFKFKRKEFLRKAFEDDCLEFLSEATKMIDYCDFYDILSLSDQQKWKDAFSILKKYER